MQHKVLEVEATTRTWSPTIFRFSNYCNHDCGCLVCLVATGTSESVIAIQRILHSRVGFCDCTKNQSTRLEAPFSATDRSCLYNGFKRLMTANDRNLMVRQTARRKKENFTTILRIMTICNVNSDQATNRRISLWVHDKEWAQWTTPHLIVPSDISDSSQKHHESSRVRLHCTSTEVWECKSVKALQN